MEMLRWNAMRQFSYARKTPGVVFVFRERVGILCASRI
jgi:hypothetical protein